MKVIKFIIMGIFLWPFALLIFVYKLRKSLTRYPKRLGINGDSGVEIAVASWLSTVSRAIPFGSSFWFVDKPKKVGPFDPEKFSKDFAEWTKDYKKRLKDEFGIE